MSTGLYWDASDPTTVRTLACDHLTSLPSAEDQLFEYKGAETPDKDLGKKLERAASGFWNSGGGFFVAGVDGRGIPNGGVRRHVGNQSRRDWVDQFIHQVAPSGPYEVRVLEGVPPAGTIESDACILIVALGESVSAPHMASDGKYYIRAGAHTVPASHFIVEAIRGRRGATAPHITFFLRPKTEAAYFAELELVNLSNVPALSVTASLSPVPPLLEQRGSGGVVHIRAIDTMHPARVPFTQMILGDKKDWYRVDEEYDLVLNYTDPFGRPHEVRHTFLPRIELPKPFGDSIPLERIAGSLARIEGRLQTLTSALQQLSQGRTLGGR